MTALELGTEPGRLVVHLQRDSRLRASIALEDDNGADVDFGDGDGLTLTLAGVAFPAVIAGNTASWDIAVDDVDYALDTRTDQTARIDLTPAGVCWFDGVIA